MYGYNFYNYRERIVMKLKKQSFSHQQTQHSSKQYGDNMNQQFFELKNGRFTQKPLILREHFKNERK